MTINGILRAMLLITTRKNAPLTSLLLPRLEPLSALCYDRHDFNPIFIKSIAGINFS